MNIAVSIFLAAGLVFALAGTVGLLRMPDVFCRLQSSTNLATLGVLGVIVAAVIYTAFGLRDWAMTVKLIVLGLFYLIPNPIASHALAKGAYARGARPFTGIDHLQDDLISEEPSENEEESHAG